MPRAAKKTPTIDKGARVGVLDVLFRAGGRRGCVLPHKASGSAATALPFRAARSGSCRTAHPRASSRTFWGAVNDRADAERAPVEWERSLTQGARPRSSARTCFSSTVRSRFGIGHGKAKKVVTYKKGTCFNARSEICNAGGP